MSDSAFKSAAFQAIMTADLVAHVEANELPAEIISKMVIEIGRRAAVNAGDRSQMTDGERLRFVKTGKAR